ncbi:MAG: 4-hydroxy-tetrahydrodipicolinate reductase [Elusimicrobiota bacterium]|nr:4-hydroxy-tetrahydrodipicolinate reductase [Elusimicrobiota bacterium]
MVKITICGVCGKMGSRILTLATQRAGEFEIVAGIEAPGHPSVGKEIQLGSALGVGVSSGDASVMTIKIESDLNKVVNLTDVVIEFTNPEATISHLEIIEAARKAAVIGTTGFKDSQIERIKSAARQIPIVLSPNMSVGMNLLFNLVKEVARTVPEYNVEIVELHHNQKKDAPSGTALKLASEINNALGGKLKNVYSREGIVGARKPDEIGIFAIRAGDIVGEHTVLFVGGSERLELIHRAHSRDTFAIGALRAVKWIVNKPAGLYSMLDVLSG